MYSAVTSHATLGLELFFSDMLRFGFTRSGCD